jgi:uncharacterized protein YbjT (DUF2867 family)
MYVVTGATGMLGGATARVPLRHRLPVRRRLNAHPHSLLPQIASKPER